MFIFLTETVKLGQVPEGVPIIFIAVMSSRVCYLRGSQGEGVISGMSLRSPLVTGGSGALGVLQKQEFSKALMGG